MKRITIVLFLIYSQSFSQSWQWVRKDGMMGQDNGNAICTDNVGNCYIAIQNSDKAAISKYSLSGNLIWKTYLHNNSSANSIVYDNSGNLYIAGNYFLAKCDTSGNIIWKKIVLYENFKSICIDNKGFLYVTGTNNLLQKYDTSGNNIWTLNINAVGYSICTDNQNYFYITGKFSNTVSFGNFILTALGCQDIFVAKFDSSGNCKWVKQAGGKMYCNYSNDNGYGITTDNSGGIYVTGSIADTAYFDSYSLIANSNDVFIAKYDTAGNVLWVKQAKGYSDEEGRCIAIDNSGNIYVGGSYVPNIFIENNIITGWGNYDAFVLKLDKDGNFLSYTKAGGNTWNEYVYGISIDNSDNVFVVGSFSSPSIFDNDTLYPSLNSIYDIFVGKINLLTNIQELKNNSFNISIYPNPSNGSFWLEVEEKIKIREIQIVDLLGRIIFQLQYINQNKIKIDNIQSGIYFIKVYDENNNFATKKLIIYH